MSQEQRRNRIATLKASAALYYIISDNAALPASTRREARQRIDSIVGELACLLANT
jgi:hypothetical protein